RERSLGVDERGKAKAERRRPCGERAQMKLFGEGIPPGVNELDSGGAAAVGPAMILLETELEELVGRQEQYTRGDAPPMFGQPGGACVESQLRPEPSENERPLEYKATPASLRKGGEGDRTIEPNGCGERCARLRNRRSAGLVEPPPHAAQITRVGPPGMSVSHESSLVASCAR